MLGDHATAPGARSRRCERARLGARGGPAGHRAPRRRSSGTAAAPALDLGARRSRRSGSRRFTTRELARAAHEPLERRPPPPRRRSPARAARTPSASVSAPPARVDRGAGVEHRQVARRARLAGEDRARGLRVLFAGRRPGSASAGARCKPDVLGRDRVAPRARPRPPRPRCVGAEMLSSSSPSSLADEQRVLGAEQRQRARHRLQVGRVGDADQLAAGAGRVGQRARGS